MAAPAQLPQPESSIIRDIARLIRDHPRDAEMAGERLSQHLSDRAAWARAKASRRTLIRSTLATGQLTRAERRAVCRQHWPGLAAFFAPADAEVRPYWRLQAVAKRLLLDTPASEGEVSLYEAWDTVLILHALMSPDANLAGRNLAKIADWRRADGWGRENIGRPEGLKEPRRRSEALRRGRAALAKLNEELVDTAYREGLRCVQHIGHLQDSAGHVMNMADVEAVAEGLRTFHNVGGDGSVASVTHDAEANRAAVRERRRDTAKLMAWPVTMLIASSAALSEAANGTVAGLRLYDPQNPITILPTLRATSYATGVLELCRRVLACAAPTERERADLESWYGRDVQVGLRVPGLDRGIMPYGVRIAEDVQKLLAGFDAGTVEASLRLEQGLATEQLRGQGQRPAARPEPEMLTASSMSGETDPAATGVRHLVGVSDRVWALYLKCRPGFGDECRRAFAEYCRIDHERFAAWKAAGQPTGDYGGPQPFAWVDPDRDKRPLGERRAVMLTGLAGLADLLHPAAPIVPRPERTGSGLADAGAEVLWLTRQPGDPRGHRPEPDPERFAPEAAQAMLAEVESWVRESGPGDSRAGPPVDLYVGLAGGSTGDGPGRAGESGAAGMAPTGPNQPVDGAWLSEADLAQIAGVNRNTLRTRLRRWRPHHHNNEWRRAENPRPRDPRFIYRWGAVKQLIGELRKTGEQPAKK